MEPFPGDRIELEDGTGAEVTTRPELVSAGVCGCEVRIGETALWAVLEDPRAPDDVRAEVRAQLRRMCARTRHVMGPELRAVRTPRSSAHVGYRDAAGSPERDALPVRLFSTEPTMLFARVLTPSSRVDWPVAVVARLAVELALAMETTSLVRVDPFSVGLDARGAWALDPALDALLRPAVRGGQLRGAVAWMGYLAPEAVRGRATGEPASSQAAALHGLGVLLHELLMGEPLYGGATPLETLIALRRGLPPSLSASIPGIPLDLAATVHALLDHDPLRRPEPARIRDLLTPIAAPDLAWAEPLFASRARPLDHLRVVPRRER